MAVGRLTAVACAAGVVFVLAATFSIGGLVDGRSWGDVGHYQSFGDAIVRGRVPYRDFYMEYPPGAIPAFVVPAGGSDAESAYRFRFKLLMFGFGALCLVGVTLVLRLLRAGVARSVVALGTIAVSPAALGHVFLNRYDPWPTLLLVAYLATLLLVRATSSGAFLGAAFAAKLFAPIAAPLGAVRLLRMREARVARTALLAFVVVSAAAFGYFAVVAHGGLGYSISTQLRRHLQTESLGASLLLAADQLGLYDARVIFGRPGSIDLAGGLPDAISVVTSVAALVAVAAAAVAYARGDETRERLVTAFATTIAGFTVFAKVLSPQYLVWLIPFVPLVRGRCGTAASALLLLALVLSQVENYGYAGLHIAGWAVWVILVRNAVLVALFVLLLAAAASPVSSQALGSRRRLFTSRMMSP